MRPSCQFVTFLQRAVNFLGFLLTPGCSRLSLEPPCRRALAIELSKTRSFSRFRSRTAEKSECKPSALLRCTLLFDASETLCETTFQLVDKALQKRHCIDFAKGHRTPLTIYELLYNPCAE